MAADKARETLEEFLGEARAFLEGSGPRRRTGADAPAFAPRDDRRALFPGSTDAEVQAARDWQRRLFDVGLGWITGPPEHGGRGLPIEYQRAFLALEREYDVPSKGPLSVSLGMIAPTVLRFGSPEATDRWLRGLHRADMVGCQLFSEPGAGSDLAAVSTSARETETGWVVNGQKVWTSGAHYSDVGLALTRTALAPRTKNLTMFLVDMDLPGVEVRPLRQMTGGAEFNEVFLTDVHVADDHRLGDVGEGWQVMLATLMFERGAIGGASSGGAGLFDLASLAEWLRYMGRDKDPAVVQAFAQVYSGVTAAKAMRSRPEAARDGHRLPGPEMSLAKLALTSNLTLLADLVSMALGPRLIADSGQPATFSWAEFVLGVPGMRIGGGTDEVQRSTIAERMLGLPKEPKSGSVRRQPSP
jgi:alkylation response protein AidB-like acyl-CoA dehydrogenase